MRRVAARRPRKSLVAVLMAGNPLGAVAAFFDFEGHQTSFQREIVAGLTTFVTMSYIIAVNPAILKEAGIPPGPSMVATILAAVVGTLDNGAVREPSVRDCPLHGRERLYRLHRR